MNEFPSAPEYLIWDHLKFLQKFVEIFDSKG